MFEAVAIKEAIWRNYFEVARAAHKCRDWKTAFSMYREALYVALGAAPDSSPGAAGSFSSIDSSNCLRENSAESLALHLQALSYHGLAAAMLDSFAGGQSCATGDRAQAEQYLRKAIRFYTISTPVDSRSFVVAVLSLADSYYHSRFPERALPLLKRSVKTITAQDGLSAPHLVPLFKRMAAIYNENRYFAKAEKFVKQAISMS